MFINDPSVLGAEVAYRSTRSRRSIAATRGARTRSGWVRRVAAADREPGTTFLAEDR